MNCKGFGEAPGVVLHALGRLQWATEKTVHLAGHTSYPPNEILVLGYFADMKIGVSTISSFIHREGYLHQEGEGNEEG